MIIDILPLESSQQYIEDFEWNYMKYRVDLPVREISHILFKEASSIESLLKAKFKKYQEISAETKKLVQKST